MCGIVGYVGCGDVVSVLLRGLTNLEYRGYDSAGIALQDEGSIKIYKTLGKLINLKNELEERKQELKRPTSGIGHIRWATHGSPSLVNAHPHTCSCGRLVVVHNGIIENYKELRAELIAKGCNFRSQTDTETIAHLVADEYVKSKDLEIAVRNSVKKLQGAYAICVMHKDVPDLIVGARKHAPMLVGIGDGENFIASDTPAIIEYTKRTIYLEDNEIAVITKNSVKVTDIEGNVVTKKIEMLPWEPIALSKLGYKHFMLKEIHEQPDVIRNVLNGKLYDIDAPISLNEVKIDRNSLKKLNKIQIIACGTSLHAALVGKYLIEDFAGIAVDVEASSEYIYRKTTTDSSTLVIGVSQSGETADTITAIKQAKEKKSHVLIITNRPDSNMARLADSLIPVNAGIEVSVAATKSYTAQLISFYLLAIHLAEIKGSLDNSYLKNIKHELIQLPTKIEEVLSNTSEIQECARKFSSYKNFIYIARGVNLATAYEGALKLKEISYINATGYAAGELKHGPIAMLDETMPVLSILIPGGITYEKILSNSEEAKARNAKLIALTSSNDRNIDALFDIVLRIPQVSEILSPAITCVPLQLLAYYIAEFLGKDVDQPRNLAKSVTVE
ncbi:TPA: glutamine--fructose-6-phosphate transaminase (isomerizing) [Candidatus Avigastranaerophilus faecigallinarum]|nr:glutamine--fructose-6-phosphate transaminase (isomerizing) [Candidatus Avigastranaerophilus faecigallinarum]